MRLAVFIAVIAFVGIVSSWKGLGGPTSAAATEQTRSGVDAAEGNSSDAVNSVSSSGALGSSFTRSAMAMNANYEPPAAEYGQGNSNVIAANSAANSSFLANCAGASKGTAETDFDNSYASIFLKPAKARPLPESAPGNTRQSAMQLMLRPSPPKTRTQQSFRLAAQGPSPITFSPKLQQQTSASYATNIAVNNSSLDGALNQLDSDWGNAPAMMATAPTQVPSAPARSSFGSPAELFSAKNILSSLFGGSGVSQQKHSIKPPAQEQPQQTHEQMPTDQGAQVQALMQRAQDQASQAEADAMRASQGSDRQSAAASAQYHANDAQSAADNAASIAYGACDNARNYAQQARAAANRAQAAAERARANAAS
jgi:hypothetical protein